MSRTSRFGLVGALLMFAVGSCVCEELVTTGVDGGSEVVDPPEELPFVSWRSAARRLSQSELDNTVRDVFGDDTSPATRLLSEDEYAPYDNGYRGQQASQALIDSLEAMAEDVAVRVTQPGAARDALVGCTPSSAGDEACFREMVNRVARRALRRPVTTAEVDRYVELLAFATEDNDYVDNDFYTAVQLFIRALLTDPEVLYRVEVGVPTEDPGVFELNDWEIASRMSFLLWGSAPDDELLDEAAAGVLTDASTRRTSAERMLQDPRAKTQLHRFHAMWLGYRTIPHPPELTAAFGRETAALLDRVIFDEQRSYLDVFLANETFVDDTLADHYGLPRPDGGEGWVSYDDTGRAGILGHGSVLAAFSKFDDTSPTQRGIFVRERLLCLNTQPPPPSVDVDQPPEPGSDACKIERYQAHMGAGSCQACHGQIDPLGFGLENYDVAGRYREHDDGRPECPIDIDGTVPDHGEFRGPKELAELIVDAQLVQECVVRQFVTFGIGHAPSPAELVEVSALAGGFEATGHSFDQLLFDFVGSEAFALKHEEPDPEEAP